MNKLVINGMTFDASDMLEAKGHTSHAMVGESLAADVIEFSATFRKTEGFVPLGETAPMVDSNNEVLLTQNENYVESLPVGSEAIYYVDNKVYGKYYLESVEQETNTTYRIRCTSIIGRLIETKHMGGIYEGVLASTIYAEILGNVPYELDANLASATVTGYLPIKSRRDNLRDLLLITGGAVDIDANGVLHIRPMTTDVRAVYNIDNVFGEGTVKHSNPVVGLKLTEHNYIKTFEVETLFDDGISGTERIEFSEPHHDLVCNGGTILESNANYAVIEANGSVLLTGKKYIHTTRIISVGDVSDNDAQGVKSISDVYLANPQVADEIANRLFDYSQFQTIIKQDIVIGNVHSGDVVEVINPFTQKMDTATIKSLDISMSNKNRASAEFILRFAPYGIISGFKNYQFLTGSGNWVVPDGVTKVRAIIVGAGDGGTGGYDGKNGDAGQYEQGRYDYYIDSFTPEHWDGGKGGVGGKAGKSGNGGKILEISMNVIPRQIISFSCGVAGNGSDANTDTVNYGSETTFGGKTSNSGRNYTYGYVEPKTGLTFGETGSDGIDGGNGGDGMAYGGEPSIYTNSGINGNNGDSVGTYSGGSGAKYASGTTGRGNNLEAFGSGGGGAAHGSAGGNAVAGYTTSGSGNYIVTAGNGGNAINPEPQTRYGSGGHGGNGGGGGGGGAVGISRNYYYDTHHGSAMNGGTGGKGSRGGRGGDGCIVLYY